MVCAVHSKVRFVPFYCSFVSSEFLMYIIYEPHLTVCIIVLLFFATMRGTLAYFLSGRDILVIKIALFLKGIFVLETSKQKLHNIFWYYRQAKGAAHCSAHLALHLSSWCKEPPDVPSVVLLQDSISL